MKKKKKKKKEDQLSLHACKVTSRYRVIFTSRLAYKVHNHEQMYVSLVAFVLLSTTKPVKILVTRNLIYNKNYLENGIHLRLLRTLNTDLEFSMKIRNLNNPKPFLISSNTFYFLPLEIVEHAYENRKADYLLISKRKGVGVEPAKCAPAKYLEQRRTYVVSLQHLSFPEGVFFH